MLKYILIVPIRFYQLVISPMTPSSCRHIPSCSQYSIEAIKEWGVLKGFVLSCKRISRCHPKGTFGFDPVPKK
jgi:putative membrane protein insertion efficiency factor